MNGYLPIPSDALVGLYHPFRDLYVKEYSRGVPFKNFLITDPVRQQIPWRNLSISIEKRLELPLWNPYNFSGYPLLANFQSGSLYPLNILFFIFSFSIAWTILVILQPVMGIVFMYLYLRKLDLTKTSSSLGAIVFAFSGSSIAWMEWNTIFHVILWLPLILLAKENLLKRYSLRWFFVLIVAEICAILAGYLQVLFYAFILTNVYLFVRVYQIHRANFFENVCPFFASWSYCWIGNYSSVVSHSSAYSFIRPVY